MPQSNERERVLREEWADWMVQRHNFCERIAGESLKEIAMYALKHYHEMAAAAQPAGTEPGLREAATEFLKRYDTLLTGCDAELVLREPAIATRAALSEQRGSAEPEPDFGTAEEVISGLDAINKHNAEVAAAAPSPTRKGHGRDWLDDCWQAWHSTVPAETAPPAPTRDFGPELRERMITPKQKELMAIRHCPFDMQDDEETPLTEPYCHANREGDCSFAYCPQPLLKVARPAAAPPAQTFSEKAKEIVYYLGGSPRANSIEYVAKSLCDGALIADRKQIIEECAKSCERRAALWATEPPNATQASIDIHAELMNEASTLRALAAEKETR